MNNTTRRALWKICADLREVDEQLAQICETLPAPTPTFNARGELRGKIQCVRTDLLRDAITTLNEAAKRGCEAEWRREYDLRSRFLAEFAERRVSC